MRGIDVSKYQGVIDFNKVKAAGYDFVIIRAGYGKALTQVDPYFEINYRNAKAAGLHVGAYWYSYTTTVRGAELEANTCLEALRGKVFDMPIYYDVEEKSQLEQGSQFLGDIIDLFCTTLEKNGYFVGLYMSASHLKNIPMKVLVKYACWCAQWAKECTFNLVRVGMWQSSSKGQVPGIIGNVDIDDCYIDYPGIIKRSRLNGNDVVFNIQAIEDAITKDQEKNEADLAILYKCRDDLIALRDKYM